MEAGHACQNALLAATALGLGACPLLSYHQSAIDKWLGVDGRDEFVIYLAAIGQPARN
jgi:nitroreductase